MGAALPLAETELRQNPDDSECSFRLHEPADLAVLLKLHHSLRKILGCYPIPNYRVPKSPSLKKICVLILRRGAPEGYVLWNNRSVTRAQVFRVWARAALQKGCHVQALEMGASKNRVGPNTDTWDSNYKDAQKRTPIYRKCQMVTKLGVLAPVTSITST